MYELYKKIIITQFSGDGAVHRSPLNTVDGISDFQVEASVSSIRIGPDVSTTSDHEDPVTNLARFTPNLHLAEAQPRIGRQ